MNKIPEPLPWHQREWKGIDASFHRFPHASLISGADGVGKLQFATRLAVKLLCSVPENSPCGVCRDCRMFTAASHLDLHAITSEAVSQNLESPMKEYSERYRESGRNASRRKKVRTTILIAQTRALIEAAQTTAQISKNKVILLVPADTMTIGASNSILKILEEPASNNFLILVAENARKLMPTISSRCQIIHLSQRADSETAKWLTQNGLNDEEIESVLISGEGPLRALKNRASNMESQFASLEQMVFRILTDPTPVNVLPVAQLAVSIGTAESLRKLHMLTAALIRLNLTNAEDEGKLAELKKIAESLNARDLFAVYDYLGHIRNEIAGGALDEQLAMEDVCFRLAKINKFQRQTRSSPRR